MTEALRTGAQPAQDAGQDFVRTFDERDWAPGTEMTLFGHQYRQRVAAILGAANRWAPGPRLLDLGCAQGNIARELSRAGFRVTAVDRNPAFLDYARTREPQSRVRWMHGDLQEFRPDEPQDAVLLGEVIEHTGTPERLVAAIATMLRPGGLLILTTPNGERIRESLPTYRRWRAANGDADGWIQFGPAGEDHQFLFTRSELRHLLRSEFDRLRLTPIASAIWNRSTEPLLRHRLGRTLGNGLEAISMSLPVRSRLANGWLVTGLRR